MLESHEGLYSDGNDESAEYSRTSAPLKRIRLVSTLEFELK